MPLGLCAIPFATNIVARLRFAFIFIMLVFALGFVTNFYQLYKLYITEKNTLEVSIPSLTRSQQLEVQLRGLTSSITQLKNANGIQAANTIDRNIKERIVEVKDTLAVTPKNDDAATALNAQLIEQLNQLTTSMSLLVPLKLELLRIEDRLGGLREELVWYREGFRNIIEPLRFDLIYSLDSQISAIQASLNPDFSEKSPADDINALSIIGDISSQAGSVIDLGDYLSGSSLEDINRQTETRIKYLLRTATLSLVYIESATAREELVPLMKNLYGLILSGDGILENVNQRIGTLKEFTKAELQSRKIVIRVSNWATQNVDQALADIDQSESSIRKILFLVVLTSLVSALIIALLVGLVSHFVVELQINRRMLQLTNSVIKIADNETDHIVGITGDDEIGTIASALEIFRQNTIDLQRSNTELKEFAYAASHDLKSPLRAIENLAQWIREDAHEFLPPESRENLDLLQSRVSRLSTLQSDLLLYSQAGTSEVQYEKLDLDVMIGELQELLDPDDHFKITFTGEIPVVYTYLVPLKQVVMNLLNNAIKHHDQTSGKIVMEAKVLHATLHISVTDDGPGIDPKYHQTIFKLFKTLKSQDEVEGSGLGLSMVQKIVSRHGGNTSVRSNPEAGRGSEFLVDWPCISHTPVPA